MESHREHVDALIAKLSLAKNSKIMKLEKYRKIQAFLKRPYMDMSEIGMDRAAFAKFRFEVKKRKKYRLVKFPEANLIDVVCIRAKVPVSYFN